MKPNFIHVLALLGMAACSTEEGEKCVGGLLLDGGECLAKCQPELCVVLPNDGGPLLNEDGVPVNACVNNECMLRCKSHFDCTVPTESCLPATEDDTGNEVAICQANSTPEDVLTPCPFGDECPPGLECIAERDGDADAYCAQPDCITDEDCGAGFYCGAIRDPRDICETGKGNDVFCGRTTEPCVNQAELSADGPLFEGPLCIMRRMCLVRDDCAPCAADLDCSYSSTECVSIGGEMRCASGCTSTSDCPSDKECAGGYCVPRFGRCAGDGGGFCDPCKDDLDCGNASNAWACEEVQIGQKVCLDYGTTCVSNAQCGPTPGGGSGICAWAEQVVGLLPICHPDVDSDSGFFTCW